MSVPGKTNNPNGRPPGSVNKATAKARDAIAEFVEGNVDRLNGWLDAIANGIPEEIVKDDSGSEVVSKWLIKPDPQGAYDSLMSVVEYHIPKLARTEQQMLDKDGQPADANVTVRYIE